MTFSLTKTKLVNTTIRRGKLGSKRKTNRKTNPIGKIFSRRSGIYRIWWK